MLRRLLLLFNGFKRRHKFFHGPGTEWPTVLLRLRQRAFEMWRICASHLSLSGAGGSRLRDAKELRCCKNAPPNPDSGLLLKGGEVRLITATPCLLTPGVSFGQQPAYFLHTFGCFCQRYGQTHHHFGLPVSGSGYLCHSEHREPRLDQHWWISR